MEVEHHIHEHPLIPWEVQIDDEEKLSCYGCLLPLSSGNAAYSCTQCKFNSHKSCVELPQKIIHFLHPKHSLTLFVCNPNRKCDNCDDRIWGFSYHCSICKFDLDIKCVLLGQVIESEGHQHSLMLLRPTSFTCDACGEVGNEMSYICTICQLWVHKNCASFPPTIKHIGHDHPLSLTHTLQFPKEGLCQICSKQVNRFYWGYRCSECSYIAHLACATSNHLGGDENDPSLVSLPDEHDPSLAPLADVEGISLAENHELKHFSHGHCLILSKDEPEKKEICDGCTISISSPYYKCTDQCNFFLHVSCAELPNMKQHPLTLQYNRLIFDCSVCSNIGNGFTYNCDSCKFKIDVRCASFLSTQLRHDGHKHTLNLVQTRCSACGLDCYNKFRCEGCDFNLDLDCALLPYTARHRWDDHTLKLTYGSVKDEYYCEICEELIDPNNWFYNCEACDFSTHPKCLLGKYTLKFGETYNFILHPEHPVTLVEKTKGDLPCDLCNAPLRDLAAFVCNSCNFKAQVYILPELLRALHPKQYYLPKQFGHDTIYTL